MSYQIKESILNYLNVIKDSVFDPAGDNSFIELVKLIRLHQKQDILSDQAVAELINEILNEKILNDYQEHVLLDANMFLSFTDQKFGLL